MTASARAFLPEDEEARRAAALEESFLRFLAEHYTSILEFLLRQCFDRHLAEDAMQEAMIVAMQEWAVVSTHEKPLYWVRKIAWHKLLTLDGRQKWRDHVPLQDALPGATGLASSHEAEAVLRQLLSRLPYRQRAVLALMIEGDTDTQIAEQLGLALTTVRIYKCEVRKRYRELF